MRGHPIRPLFFFNDTATTEIYTLSLHDALPIFAGRGPPSDHDILARADRFAERLCLPRFNDPGGHIVVRSEEHTSELQSRPHLVCRLLLEKKNMSSVDAESVCIRPSMASLVSTT